jgi:hypothetical protein
VEALLAHVMAGSVISGHGYSSRSAVWALTTWPARPRFFLPRRKYRSHLSDLLASAAFPDWRPVKPPAER